MDKWVILKICAACSDCVVFLLLARFGESFHAYTYKIYTLGRFQFNSLLRKNLVIRVAGGFWI